MNDSGGDPVAAAELDHHLLTTQIGATYRALIGCFERFVGITVARFRVLQAFADTQELSQSQLQQQLGLDAASITRQVKAMEAEGLVVRRADPGDNRFTLVTLTDSGRARVDALLPLARSFGTKLQEGCDSSEVAIAAQVLQGIRQRALEMAANPSAEVGAGTSMRH